MNWNRQELLAILPQRMRTFDFEQAQELRLRVGRPPRLVAHGGFADQPGIVESQDIRYVINAASRYSPWTAASMAQGYLTAPGGHRIGICGHGAGEGPSGRGPWAQKGGPALGSGSEPLVDTLLSLPCSPTMKIQKAPMGILG